MATLSIAAEDKAPATTTAFRSDAKTIPWIAAGGEKIGDIIERAAALQQYGVVSSLKNSEDTAATAGDEIQLRIHGMFLAPKAAVVLNDGDFVTWDSGNTNFTNTGVGFVTGAHEVVGGYAAGDANCLVRLNVHPRAAT